LFGLNLRLIKCEGAIGAGLGFVPVVWHFAVGAIAEHNFIFFLLWW